MYAGKVVGCLVSTVKDDALNGIKLLAVQTIDNGRPGKIIIAADIVRVAGIGDFVYYTTGREAAIGLGSGLIPIDAGIVAIIDKYNVNLQDEDENDRKQVFLNG